MLALLLTASLSIAQEKEAPKQLLITNVKVWDGTSDKTIDADVLVEGNKIKKIGSSFGKVYFSIEKGKLYFCAPRDAA
jgi:hypothetical protein